MAKVSYKVLAFNHENVIATRDLGTRVEATKQARQWAKFDNVNMVRVWRQNPSVKLVEVYVSNYGQNVVIRDGVVKKIRV